MQRTMVQKTWGHIVRRLLISMLVLLEAGCVAVLSDRVRQEADRSLSFAQIRLQPEAYIGRLIIGGGDIVRTTYIPGVTFLEVVQKPLDSEDRPQVTGQSEGRFMVRYEGYLDPLVYQVGQVVTLAGRVLGTHTEKIGDTDVSYPLLSCVEIYTWSPPVPAVLVYPGIWYWWEWEPWYWHHHHHHHHHHFGGRRRYHRHR